MIPGSNLLNLALSVIARQQFQYFQFLSRAQNAIGQDIATYAAPLSLSGSVQPVPRELYHDNGLDFQRNYFLFYVSENVIDPRRDVSGDIMNFAGNTYQCISENDWFPIDGWTGVLCVQVENTPLVVGITAPSLGNYTTSQSLTFTVNFSMAVNVTGAPQIQLSALSGIIGGNAVYTGGTGTTALTFAYVVQSGDTANGISAASPVATVDQNLSAIGTIIGASSNVAANASFVVPNLTGVTLNA